MLEVRGEYPLRIGTRVCAFWSSQYHSLYPGSVTSFSSLDESEDENYTAVEFDDGDSGRIKISNIFVLPQDVGRNRKFCSVSLQPKKKKKEKKCLLNIHASDNYYIVTECNPACLSNRVMGKAR